MFFYLQTTEDQIQDDPLFQYSISILGFWIINFFLVWVLYEFNNPINKLRISRWLHLRLFRQNVFDPIFDEDKLLWLPFLTNYLDKPEDLSKINDRVGLTLYSNMTEFATENGYMTLTKVFFKGKL